jgi:hypothetical protein
MGESGCGGTEHLKFCSVLPFQRARCMDTAGLVLGRRCHLASLSHDLWATACLLLLRTICYGKPMSIKSYTLVAESRATPPAVRCDRIELGPKK